MLYQLSYLANSAQSAEGIVPASRGVRIGLARTWDTLPRVSVDPTAGSAPSLAARDVVRSFGDERVLDGVTLARDGAGVIGLVGANGAGKTTLLRVIAQLAEPNAGTLDICGRRVEHADDPVARRLVGWAPHEPLAWRDDSVERNLRYAAQLAGLDRRRARTTADAAIELWGLRTVAHTPMRRLSRGWAQRYSLARADLLGPPILLLDEPTTGLDATARGVLEDAIEAWRRERIVVVASHERDWLAERCDQLLDLDVPARQVVPA